MANMPQYLTDQLLNWLKHTAFATTPVTGYLALLTTAGTLSSGGTEVTGGSYARTAITMASGWSAISTVNGARQMTNAGDIVFVTATADWATNASPVVAWALMDALTVGNRLAFGNFDAPFPVLNGQTAKVLAGALALAVN
jgi:hypothetical protein